VFIGKRDRQPVRTVVFDADIAELLLVERLDQAALLR